MIAAVCDQILTTQLQHMMTCYSLLLEEPQPMTAQQLEVKGGQVLQEITGAKVSHDSGTARAKGWDTVGDDCIGRLGTGNQSRVE